MPYVKSLAKGIISSEKLHIIIKEKGHFTNTGPRAEGRLIIQSWESESQGSCPPGPALGRLSSRHLQARLRQVLQFPGEIPIGQLGVGSHYRDEAPGGPRLGRDTLQGRPGQGLRQIMFLEAPRMSGSTGAWGLCGGGRGKDVGCSPKGSVAKMGTQSPVRETRMWGGSLKAPGGIEAGNTSLSSGPNPCQRAQAKRHSGFLQEWPSLAQGWPATLIEMCLGSDGLRAGHGSLRNGSLLSCAHIYTALAPGIQDTIFSLLGPQIQQNLDLFKCFKNNLC